MMDPPAKKLAELTQRLFPRRLQTMTLFEDRIEVRVRGLLDRYRMPFYLHALKEEPDHVLTIPWAALALVGIVFGAGMALSLLEARPSDRTAGMILSGLGAAGIAASLLGVRRLHVYFYKAVPGADAARVRYEPQLYLSPDRPTPDEVRRFEDLIRIAREKQVEKMRMEQEEPGSATRELERFANLRRDDVVTEDEYAQVKAKLLNLKPRRIGF